MGWGSNGRRRLRAASGRPLSFTPLDQARRHCGAVAAEFLSGGHPAFPWAGNSTGPLWRPHSPGKLRAFVVRIEHVDEEIAIEHVDEEIRISRRQERHLAHAKGQDFDVNVLREAIRIRKKDQKERTRRSCCSTSTFRHWRPPCHQSRRRVIKAVRASGPPFPLCTRPAIADYRSCLRSLDVSYSGAPTSGSKSASHRQLGDISLTAPGQMP